MQTAAVAVHTAGQGHSEWFISSMTATQVEYTFWLLSSLPVPSGTEVKIEGHLCSVLESGRWGCAQGFASLCVNAQSLSRVQLFTTPWTIAHQAFVHGVFQARLLEWFSISYSRWSSQPGDRTLLSYISRTGRWVLYHECHLWSLERTASCMQIGTKKGVHQKDCKRAETGSENGQEANHKGWGPSC